MIPGEMLIITNFLTITKLHWIDTYQAMIVPLDFERLLYLPADPVLYAGAGRFVPGRQG